MPDYYSLYMQFFVPPYFSNKSVFLFILFHHIFNQFNVTVSWLLLMCSVSAEIILLMFGTDPKRSMVYRFDGFPYITITIFRAMIKITVQLF